MLHLALQDADQGRLIDYLFTDAPGEWFQKWAINIDSMEGVGARWVSDRADAFLVVADREALSDEATMGSARGSLQLLAKRLGSERPAPGSKGPARRTGWMQEDAGSRFGSCVAPY